MDEGSCHFGIFMVLFIAHKRIKLGTGLSAKPNSGNSGKDHIPTDAVNGLLLLKDIFWTLEKLLF